MIEYLIKSGIALMILLVIYHLWLEQEKMHRFNRFYLLFSLVFGLTIPLIEITLPGTGFVATPLPMNEFTFPDVSPFAPAEFSKVETLHDSHLISLIYYIVVAVLLIRFIINLFILLRTASKNPKKVTPEGTIVLIKDTVAPHSFLFFTFLNKDDYLNQKIEQEIIKHEFAHVRQKHSADLLFLEFLMVILWFNPIFILYKRAIQLNHEFLADEAVIESSCNISLYQQLLLQKATLKSVNLASNFNFSVTKKRFKMMKKQTSKTWKMVKVASLLPVTALLVVVFSNNTIAQGTSAVTNLSININSNAQLTKDEYYKGAYMRYINKDGVTIRKKYEELTKEEKDFYPAPVQPTEELMNTWQDSKKFVVLIGYDEPKVPLANHKAKDFVSYYEMPSTNNGPTYIFLIDRNFLETNKILGGDFNREGSEVFLAPPPPVVSPKKN